MIVESMGKKCFLGLMLSAFYIACPGGSASAVDTQARTVQMLGKGVSASCGTWLAERKTKEIWLFGGTWILGFMSGAASALDRNLLDGLDSEAVFAWMDRYCRAHPLDKIADAANRLLEQRAQERK